ncbi:hypothetical protein HZS_4698 [Henneguya salminicola]|nr:hypothetical protein HZS_4698 [Henneguya salminicola]
MQMNQHSHGSDAAQLRVSMVMSGIERRAKETTEIPSVILNAALQQTSTAVQAKMPNKDAIRKVIRASTTPDRASIIIPDAYRICEVVPGQMEEFLPWDSGEQDENRIFLFGRQSNREWSHLIEKLYVDGTFSLAPALSSQINVIMAARGGFMLPGLYALLSNKEGRTYRRLFEAIKELWPYLNPSSISIDIEPAAIGAILTTFPNCAIHGCLFDLTKNLRRKLADEGLCRRYNTYHDSAVATRLIVALSVIPIEDIDNVYIGCQNRNLTRRSALFPSHMWPVYERTDNGENRTNNYVEATHRRLQAEFWMDHPNI